MKLQTSVEFLIILAVALLALFAFMVLTQSETIVVTKAKMNKEADDAVNQLAGAAADVYAQGAGARKMISVTIPAGYEWNESFIDEGAIKMRVAGSDHVAIRDIDMYGNLPLSSGRHSLWVVSEGDRVRIGTSLISLDQETVNLVMGRNDTRIWQVNVLNTWSEPVTVVVDEDWYYPEVGLSLSDYSFTLDKGSSRAITLTFGSESGALGFYPGSLNFTSSTPNITESIRLPLSVEVSLGRGMKDGPPLMAIPSFIEAHMVANSSRSEIFRVCTNRVTSLNSVTFTPSLEEPGSWVGNYDDLENLEAGSCQFKTITINTPQQAAIGNYSGYIYLSGDASGANDAIALSVTIGGSPYDTQGPSVTDITVFPNNRKIFEGEPITIRATADDTLSGNNTVEGCRLSIDGGQWYQMIAGDGWFNEPQEYASMAFYSGLDAGEHTASVQCTDALDNSGSIVNGTFRVMNAFLFVDKESSASAEEQAWTSWLDAGQSAEGNVWSVASTDAATFAGGSINLNDYAVVVVEQWDDSMLGRMSSFLGSGGSAVFLGQSLAEAPAALGYSVQSSNPTANDSYGYVVGSHYITQGMPANVTIFATNSTSGRFWKDFSGTLLIRSPSGAPPHFHMLGVAGRAYFWGPYDPGDLSINGAVISTRVFDHAINSSTGGG